MSCLPVPFLVLLAVSELRLWFRSASLRVIAQPNVSFHMEPRVLGPIGVFAPLFTPNLTAG